MTAEITLTLSDKVIETLRKERELTLVLETAGRAPGRRPATSRKGRRKVAARPPRAGSLPARILAWAEKRGDRLFRAADVMRRFKVSRAHAAMLLTRLASGPHPIERQERGVYAYRV